MQFVLTDAGRSKSKRPRQQNDCAVRVLALATGVDYDTAYDYLKELGRKSSQAFKFPKPYGDDSALGYRFIYKHSPLVNGQEVLTCRRFCELHPTGTYVLREDGHVSVCIDGIIYDYFDNVRTKKQVNPETFDMTVYLYWKVILER